MNYIVNRSLLIVKAKQPFVDWANSHGDKINDMTIERMNEDDTVYLVRDYFDNAEKEEIITKYYEDIFEDKLNGWMTDQSTWPKQRDYRTFREWFDVEFHSMVIDMEDDDYLIEEYEV
jgi:hypothetical protein